MYYILHQKTTKYLYLTGETPQEKLQSSHSKCVLRKTMKNTPEFT